MHREQTVINVVQAACTCLCIHSSFIVCVNMVGTMCFEVANFFLLRLKEMNVCVCVFIQMQGNICLVMLD